MSGGAASRRSVLAGLGAVFMTAASPAPAVAVPVLFVGDSLTYGWDVLGRDVWDDALAPLGAVAWGIGGIGTRGLLARLRAGAIDRLEPEVIVLLIGTNDLGRGMSASATADGVAACVRFLRTAAPRARIVAMGILPRGPGVDPQAPMRRAVDATNARIAKLADGEHVVYFDAGSAFVDERGTLREEMYDGDALHLSASGYAAWAKAIRPLLLRLLR